jgi:hypothetical protein
MPFLRQSRRPVLLGFLASFVLFATVAPIQLRAQDEDNPKPEQHGRKYKAPPETTHIEVTVLKGFNKKPIDGAHVVFHPVKDGKDIGNLELKTHQDGKAIIDVIPTGSKVRIQVIADGFATYAQDYQINEASREIVVAMVRPQAQVSAYIDNQGKPSQVNPGIQEPIRPKKATTATGTSTTSGSSSNSGTKPQP